MLKEREQQKEKCHLIKKEIKRNRQEFKEGQKEYGDLDGDLLAEEDVAEKKEEEPDSKRA